MTKREYNRKWQAEHPNYNRDYKRGLRLREPNRVKWEFKEWYLRKYYGISKAQYEALCQAQHNSCGICGRTPPFGRFKHLAVDHDHKTGKVRGLLCNHCNSFLGRVKDDPWRIVAYMERAK